MATASAVDGHDQAAALAGDIGELAATGTATAVGGDRGVAVEVELVDAAVAPHLLLALGQGTAARRSAAATRRCRQPSDPGMRAAASGLRSG